jgi:uncharacterized membrane protein
MTNVELKTPVKGSAMARLRRYFFTGVVIIAPAAITVSATLWFIDKFDAIVKPWLPAEYNPDTYLPFKVPGFGLLVALIGITLVGFLGANFVGRRVVGVWDRLLNSTPVVRGLYKSSKQVFETLFSDQGASFRQVCLLEWPRKGIWAIGFVSREVDGAELGLDAGRKMFAVYVSTTPNPTGGYVYFVDQDDCKIIDMSVEDGLKLVISMGLVFPDRPLPKTEEAKSGRRFLKRASPKPKA